MPAGKRAQDGPGGIQGVLEGKCAIECRVLGLRYKEVINVSDDSHCGWVGDVEVDLDDGQARALVVSGCPWLLGLLGREEDRVFPWEAVRRFGADTILVEAPPLGYLGKGN